jgi:hypothetical protein
VPERAAVLKGAAGGDGKRTGNSFDQALSGVDLLLDPAQLPVYPHLLTVHDRSGG